MLLCDVSLTGLPLTQQFGIYSITWIDQTLGSCQGILLDPLVSPGLVKCSLRDLATVANYLPFQRHRKDSGDGAIVFDCPC